MVYKKLLRNSSGQILPLVAVTVLILTMFAVVALNISQLEYDRQRAQTAADAAALTGARSMAQVYNACSTLNQPIRPAFLLAGAVLYGHIFHNNKSAWCSKKLEGVPGWMAVDLLCKAAIGMCKIAPAWASNAYKGAIDANEAKGIPLAVGVWKSGLKIQHVKLRLFDNIKIVMIGPVPVPIPIPPWPVETKDKYPCYVARNDDGNMWKPADTRKAQPQFKITSIVYREFTPWGMSLLGLGSGKVQVRAVASAGIYLNVKQSASEIFFNSGFPRHDKSEGWHGWGEEPMGGYPQFDARLIPVSMAGVSMWH